MLGTKIMMDLAIDSINEGDLVFVIPEINEQSMSLYFNASATLKAIEDDFSILNKIDSNNRNSVYAEYFNFISERGKYKEIIEPGETVYRRDSFNKYGDISYAFADKNIMMLHYDPTMKVDFNLKINDEFASYVNAFARRVEKKKAACFYTWSPVNNLSTDNSGLDDFYWNVRKALNMHVVGNPEEFIFDNHYFYDSNFHLNNSGAKLRTLSTKGSEPSKAKVRMTPKEARTMLSTIYDKAFQQKYSKAVPIDMVDETITTFHEYAQMLSNAWTYFDKRHLLDKRKDTGFDPQKDFNGELGAWQKEAKKQKSLFRIEIGAPQSTEGER